jgi:hypothetical protein
MKTNINFWSYLAQFFFLEWNAVHTKIVEKSEVRILYSITFFSGSRTVYEKMWKNIVERDRPQITIWRMRIAYWMPKATNAHSQSVWLIAFPRQQWLHKRATALRYVYTDCHYLFCTFICVFVCVVLVFCAGYLIGNVAVEPAYE